MKREKTKPVILGRVVFLLLTLMSPLIIFGQANGQAYNHPSHPQRAYKNHPYKNNTYKSSPYRGSAYKNNSYKNRSRGNRIHHRPTVILTNPEKVGPPTLLRQLNPRTFGASPLTPLPSPPSSPKVGIREGIIINATPLHQPRRPSVRERHFFKGNAKENQGLYQNRPHYPYHNGRYGTVERTSGGTIIIRW